MSSEDFEAHLRTLGWTVERLQGKDGNRYIVIRDYKIAAGSLAGRVCDVALQHLAMVPYIPPAAIHTRPALVQMDSVGPLHTQQSGIGPEWQYWSRTVRGLATARGLVAHIATVFSEV